MISECKIQNYICQIELEISDGNCTFDNQNRVQYDGRLYGVKIANGIKTYPIKSGAVEITDEFKRGVLKGLRDVLFCVEKPELPKKIDMKINVKYELDKAVYRKFIADMKDIEAEFKAFRYKAEKYKDDTNISETTATRISYESSMEDFIHKLGYTIRSTDHKDTFKFDSVDYHTKRYGKAHDNLNSNLKYLSEMAPELVDVGPGFSNLCRKLKDECVNQKNDGDTTEQIPVKLKDVCEWWIKTYPTNEDIFKNIPKDVIDNDSDDPEYQRCCHIAEARIIIGFIYSGIK